MKLFPPLKAAGVCLALIGSLSLAGCGASSDSGADTGGSTRPSTPSASTFPVTIEHRYGSTTITDRAERVVTVGLTDQDAVLALGTVPVATTNWFGEDPGRIFPWATSFLGDAPVPEVLGSETEFEKVASLHPDLILAMYAGISKHDYELLSAIAPTVAAPKGYVDYGVPWQVSTRTIGTALGKPAEADRLVRNVDRKIRAARTAHPEFAGKTGIVAALYEGIFVYGAEDPRARLLTSLGFEFPASLSDVGLDEFGGSISAENADRVDVDALVWLDERQRVLAALPQYADLTVSARGHDVFVPEGDPLYEATSFQTVLSIPYLLDDLVPRLAAAVDDDASTPTY